MPDWCHYYHAISLTPTLLTIFPINYSGSLTFAETRFRFNGTRVSITPATPPAPAAAPRMVAPLRLALIPTTDTGTDTGT